jgi:hypothetical protein
MSYHRHCPKRHRIISRRGDGFVRPSPLARIYWCARCTPLVFSFIKFLLIIPFVIDLVFLYMRIKIVIAFGQTKCIFAFAEEWNMEEIMEMIAKLKEILPRIEEINSFFGVTNLKYTIVVTDSVKDCRYAEALPLFRMVRLPASLFLGLYPPIYCGLKFKFDFIVLHEYAHLVVRHIVAKKCGFLAAYTIPEQLEELLCDSISVMFIDGKKVISLISRCLYLRIKWLVRSEHLEKLIDRFYRAISTASLLGDRKIEIFT